MCKGHCLCGNPKLGLDRLYVDLRLFRVSGFGFVTVRVSGEVGSKHEFETRNKDCMHTNADYERKAQAAL